MNKTEIINRLRVLRLKCIENDCNMQAIIDNQTNDVMIKKAKKHYKEVKKEIKKQLRQLEKEAYKC
ncbi:MAG: hypothetical protein KBT03_04040 [Bacteroidales bacterium]|nr:hypothetical protein [Candidatus Scybalousia scybalohippi]